MLAVSLCTFGCRIPKSAQKYGIFNKKKYYPPLNNFKHTIIGVFFDENEGKNDRRGEMKNEKRKENRKKMKEWKKRKRNRKKKKE